MYILAEVITIIISTCFCLGISQSCRALVAVSNPNPLVPQGMHSSLNTLIEFRPHIVVDPGAAYMFDLMLQFAMPDGCYIDPFEFERLRISTINADKALLYVDYEHANPESIASAASYPIFVELLNVRTISGIINFTLPIHMRYHKAVSTYDARVTVSVPPPVVFMRQEGLQESSLMPIPPSIIAISAVDTKFMNDMDSYSQCSSASMATDAEYSFPLGSLSQSERIHAVTFVIVACTTLSLGYILLFC